MARGVSRQHTSRAEAIESNPLLCLILDSGASLRSLRRQHGLPLDDGVVSGIATIISNSPAEATIARVRKAAL
jgi:hypothetical protein